MEGKVLIRVVTEDLLHSKDLFNEFLNEKCVLSIEKQCKGRIFHEEINDYFIKKGNKSFFDLHIKKFYDVLGGFISNRKDISIVTKYKSNGISKGKFIKGLVIKDNYESDIRLKESDRLKKFRKETKTKPNLRIFRSKNHMLLKNIDKITDENRDHVNLLITNLFEKDVIRWMREDIDITEDITQDWIREYVNSSVIDSNEHTNIEIHVGDLYLNFVYKKHKNFKYSHRHERFMGV